MLSWDSEEERMSGEMEGPCEIGPFIGSITALMTEEASRDSRMKRTLLSYHVWL